MGKVDKWQRQVDRLNDRIADMEDLQIYNEDGDITDAQVDKLRSSRDKYQEMIDNYDEYD